MSKKFRRVFIRSADMGNCHLWVDERGEAVLRDTGLVG